MVSYEPRVLKEVATNLSSRARSLEITYAVVGALLAGNGGAVVAEGEPSAAVDLGLLGAALGYGVARAKAFELHVRAQTDLCEVDIERNTHAMSATPESSTDSS